MLALLHNEISFGFANISPYNLLKEKRVNLEATAKNAFLCVDLQLQGHLYIIYIQKCIKIHLKEVTQNRGFKKQGFAPVWKRGLEQTFNV